MGLGVFELAHGKSRFLIIGTCGSLSPKHTYLTLACIALYA